MVSLGTRLFAHAVREESGTETRRWLREYFRRKRSPLLHMYLPRSGLNGFEDGDHDKEDDGQ